MNKKLKYKVKDICENNKLLVKSKNSIKGITLIALIITIIVLLILARSKHSNTYRR